MTGKIRALIIDDEEDLCRVLKLNLERTGRFMVQTATDGKTGIQHARKDRPDIIILDIMMPEMSGSEVAEVLGDDPATRSIPIVFLTALIKKNEVEERGGYIKDHPFIAKPVSLEELIASIESTLDVRRDRLRLEGN